MSAIAGIRRSNNLKLISARVPTFALTVIIAIVALQATALAQVTFTGVPTSQNFGTQQIGSASASEPINFSIGSGTRVGSIAVLTMGDANLDFTKSAATTCVAQTYAANTSCTVGVGFTPVAAGMRMGAIVFFSQAGNKGTVLANVPVYGVGSGPQIAFMGPNTARAVTSKVTNDVPMTNPIAVTSDAAGNLFVLDNPTAPSRYRLLEIPVSGARATAIEPMINGEALYLPSCIALDGAGDVFIGEFYGRVVEVPAGGGAATAITPSVSGSALTYPSGLALDGAGDLFIADFLNDRVLEVPANGGAAIAIDPTVNGLSLNDPHGLALNAVGDLFIADLGNNRIVTVPASGGPATAVDPEVNGEGLSSPEALAVDGAGDVFIADNANLRVVEVPAGGGAAVEVNPTWLDGGFGEVSGVAVDGIGDLFIVEAGYESGPDTLEELQRSIVPVLSYASTTNVGTIDITDGTQTVKVVNVGSQNLAFTALNYPPDFSAQAGDAAACTGSTSLPPGQQCDLPIQFSPTGSGKLNESVTLTDNAANIQGQQQAIVVSGSAQQQAEITSPVAGTVFPGPNVTFTWTAASSGVTWYMLTLGSTGPGSKDVYNSGYRTVTTWPVTGLLINGETIYARLTTNFNGVKLIADYIYSAALPGALSSPVAGAVLSGSSVAFTWTPGAGENGYELRVGSTSAGSNGIFDSGQVTGTSASVAAMPTNGATIYVRLITNFNGASVHSDYTFTAATVSVLTSPVAGTVLTGPSVRFVSTASANVSGIQLVLGNSGPGSNNVYDSGVVAGTSITATRLPTNGERLYARLYTNARGIRSYVDSTYMAARSGVLVLPQPGSSIHGPNAMFRWTPGIGASGYAMTLGTTGAGSSDVYNSGEEKSTVATVTNLRGKGPTVYVRLTTRFGAVSVYADYTYTVE